MANLSRRDYLIVIIVSCFIIGASVVTTVLAVRHSSSSPTNAATAGYTHVTFTDAVLACHKNTRDTFGPRVHTLVTDNHSSHHAYQDYLFKIFLKMDLHKTDGEGSLLNYVNCFVHSGSGEIRVYQVLEELENGEVVESGRGDTNVFGMPIKN